MYALNYLYFVILSLMLLLFLYSSSTNVQHPLLKKKRLSFNGPEIFWVLLFSTGLLALSAPAGLDLMAVRLLFLEVLCLMALAKAAGRPSMPTPVQLYLVFMLWLIIGCLYSPSAFYGFRVILKYLYPLLILLTASSVVRHEEVMLKSALGARIVALVALVIWLSTAEHLLLPGVFWYGTARAINYITISMFSLALFFCLKRPRDLFFSVLFLLPCLLWVYRTSIMGSLVALMVFALYRYRLKALPIIVLLFILGVSSVFYIPALRNKMFRDADITLTDFLAGEVNQHDIESNARFAMWDYFEKHFYIGHELTGSGTGATQQHFYTHKLFGGLQVMHSDMVQMKCDNGIVALCLYYGAILLMVLHSFRIYARHKNPWVKLCAITAGSSLVGVAATMYSDNVVNYSMCTLSYPFGFYGMMLGLLKSHSSSRI